MALLLCQLLSSERDVNEQTVLADLDLGLSDILDLWDEVREEFAERSVAPDVDPNDFDPHMTVYEVAALMTSFLAASNGRLADDLRC
ncbi:hypothetical protein ACFFRE_01445 [Aciditerrimonas ferrireducens]|uniref:Carrier domain-containing protein n=1 Tax=Aciditerrimonas ferrireducens TaxID=667306 RepID=A0ABV6BZG0_9ACTN